MNKKYIYIAIAVVIAILISLYIGKSIGQKDQRDAEIKKEVKIIHVENKESLKKIDSLNKLVKNLSKKDISLKKEELKTKEKADQITLVKPTNKDCDELYDNATRKVALLEKTIVIKDSVESNLRSEIKLKDNIIFEKDRIISNKDREIALIKEASKPRDKKYSISIHVGTGAAITKNSQSVNLQFVPVYVGVGLSRNILSF